MEMKAAGMIDETTDLGEVDFARVAEACGVRGWKVESASLLDATLEEAFAHPGPALVDVRIAKQELSLPPKIEAAQAKGFSLYMLRAVMSGRGSEVVDLAKTNVLR